MQYRIKIFPGYVSANLRNELFQMADAIVLPYRKVFQSGVMLMGMSYGKAVIASDLLPNKEIINDGVNGYLFKSNDEASLSSVINKAMGDDVMRQEMGKAGKKYVSTNHNWDLIASKWLTLFEK